MSGGAMIADGLPLLTPSGSRPRGRALPQPPNCRHGHVERFRQWPPPCRYEVHSLRALL